MQLLSQSVLASIFELIRAHNSKGRFHCSPPETSLHRGKQRYGFTRKASRSVKQWYRFKIDDTIPILTHGITQ